MLVFLNNERIVRYMNNLYGDLKMTYTYNYYYNLVQQIEKKVGDKRLAEILARQELINLSK